MKDNKKMLALGAILIAAIIGIMAYFMMSTSGDETPTPVGNQIDFTGADIKEEKNGKVIWAIWAEKIALDPKTKALTFTNVKATYDNDGTVSVLTADTGSLTGNHKNLSVSGHVKVISSEGATFTTDKIDLNNDTKILTAPAFTYKDKDTTITGDAVEGNINLETIKVKGHARLVKQ